MLNMGEVMRSEVWSSVLLVTLLWTVALAIQPRDFQMTYNKDKLAVGDTLELRCSLTGEGNASLKIHHNHRVLTQFETFSDERSVHVVIANVSLEHQGSYHCYRGKDKRPSTIRIDVGYPPVKPMNIQCVSYGLQNMTCRWDPVKTSEDLHFRTNWTLFYKIGIDSTMDTTGSLLHGTACPNPQQSAACFWYGHDPSDASYDFKPGFFYHVWVIANNILGSTTSEVHLVNTTAIVKLNPVTDVSVHLANSSSAQVSWTITLPNARLTLIYELIYRCADCVKKETFQWGDVKHKKFTGYSAEATLTDLEPFTRYTISVRMKTKHGGYWSDPSQPVLITTDEDLPRASPTLTNSSFTIFHSSSKGRQLSIYWRVLEKRFRSGVIIKYRMEVVPPPVGSEGVYIVTGAPPMPTPMMHSLLLDEDQDYRVRICAATSKGCGPYSPPLLIPPQSEAGPLVQGVIAEANSTVVVVSWKKPDITLNVRAILVHRCQGEVTQPGTHVAQCKYGYNWNRVNSHMDSTSLPISEEKGYVFGVSLETDLGSSGIVWSPCVFKLSGTPGKVQKVSVELSRETWVTLSWTPVSCRSARVWIQHYEVSVCEEVTGTQHSCECQQGSQRTFAGAWDLNAADVEGLNPGAAYRLCVRAVGKHGPGAWSDALLLKTKTPVPWGMISGCSIAGVILMVIVIVCLWIRHYMNNPVVTKFEIPEPMDFYEHDETGGETGTVSKGDHIYTLTVGEQEPLMSDPVGERGEWAGKLQHFPVSHDSGNDSLSEESGQPAMDSRDDMTIPLTLSLKDDNGSRPGGEDDDTAVTERTKLPQKRESGFFDELSPVGSPLPVLEKGMPFKVPCPAGDDTNIVVCHVHRQDQEEPSDTINSYSKFEQHDDSCPDSTSSGCVRSVNSLYTAFDDISKNLIRDPRKPQSDLTKTDPHPYKPDPSWRVKTENIISKRLLGAEKELFENKNYNNNRTGDCDRQDSLGEVDDLEFDEESVNDADDSAQSKRYASHDSTAQVVAPLTSSVIQVKGPAIVPYVQISAQGQSEFQPSTPASPAISDYVQTAAILPDGTAAPSTGHVPKPQGTSPPVTALSGGYVSH